MLHLRRQVVGLLVIVVVASLSFGAFAGGAVASPSSKRDAAAAAASKRAKAKYRVNARRQLMRQVKKNPRIVKSRSFLRKAGLVDFVLPVTIRIRTPCPAGVGGAAYCPAGAGNTALNQRKNAAANVDLGASLGQRTIGLDGSLAAEVRFNDSYDGGALGNVSVALLPSSTKKIRTTSVPILWTPEVGDMTSDADGPINRFDKGLMDAVRNDPGHGLAVGAYALTREQGCADAQAQVPPVASANNPASTHNPFPHNTRMTNALLTTALTGVPPGDGQPGYTALFAETPYSFVGPAAFGKGLPGFPYYGPGATGLLSGTGLLPPTPIDVTSLPGPAAPHLPTAFLPIYWGVERIDNLKSGYQAGDNEILGPNQTPFPYPAIAPGGFSQPPNVRSTVLRTNALELTVATAGTQVDLANGTGAPPGSSPPALPTGEKSQNVIVGKSGGEANLFGNIPGKGYGIDVTVSLATKINSIIRIHDQDLWELPLEEDDEYPAGLFNCRQVWTGAVQNYIPGIRLQGNLRISPAITKDGKLRIAKASVTTSQPQGVALTACVMPYSAYVANNSNVASSGYTTDTFVLGDPLQPGAAHVPTAAETLTMFPPQTGFLLMPFDSNALPAILTQRRYSGGGQAGVLGDAPSNIPCNTQPTDIIYRSGLHGFVNPQTAASLGNGYTTTVDGSRVTVRGDITTDLDVDVIIGDAP